LKKLVLILLFFFVPALALAQTVEERLGNLENILKKVSVSGTVEAEVGYSSDYEDVDESSVDLTTFELGIDVDLHKYVSSSVLLLWEDDEEQVVLDEGFITLGNTEEYPFYLNVGKLYVPFGVFETHMISDPLTLEIGETREGAALLGFEHEGLYGSVYAFNGDINETGEDDDLTDNFGVNVGYAYESEQFNLDACIGWINNIADSDGLTDALEKLEKEEIDDYVGGFAASAVFSMADFTLIGEYLTATDDIEAEAVDTKAEPSAFNIEVGYTLDVAGYETTVAAAYQGTDEAVALGLPEERYMGVVSVALMDGLSLGLEYAHDEDYDEADNGTGENSESVTMQLALEF